MSAYTGLKHKHVDTHTHTLRDLKAFCICFTLYDLSAPSLELLQFLRVSTRILLTPSGHSVIVSILNRHWRFIRIYLEKHKTKVWLTLRGLRAWFSIFFFSQVAQIRSVMLKGQLTKNFPFSAHGSRLMRLWWWFSNPRNHSGVSWKEATVDLGVFFYKNPTLTSPFQVKFNCHVFWTPHKEYGCMLCFSSLAFLSTCQPSTGLTLGGIRSLCVICGNARGMNQISVNASVPQQTDGIFAGSESPVSLKMQQWSVKGVITCANQYIYGANELLGSFLSPPP